MTKEQTLTLMRGYPASGKSTKAANLVKHDPKRVIVSYDAIRTMLACNPKLWRSQKKRAIGEDTIGTIAHNIIDTLLAKGISVVSDAQHLNYAHCESEIALANKYGVKVVIKDCKTPIEECIRRNSERPKETQVPESYIRRQFAIYGYDWIDPEDLINNHITLIDKMRSTGNVKVRQVDGEKDVYSCNFTRDAFLNRDWDQYSSIARGLFLNGNGQVIARGFDKFFNIGENPETSLDQVMKKMEYPVRLEIKQNGFLGLIWADPERDNQFKFYSKSGYTDYSALIEKAFTTDVPSQTRVELYQLMRQHNVTLTCEVIDPTSDKHIIPYTSTQLYILHAVKNQRTFAIDDQADAAIETLLPNNVTPSITLDNEDQLNKAIHRITTNDTIDGISSHPFKHKGSYMASSNASKKMIVEGAVLYGSNGYMCKVKSNYYLFVKSLRTDLHKALIEGKRIKPDQTTPRGRALHAILAQPQSVLDSFLYIRDQFDIQEVNMVAVGQWLQEQGLIPYNDPHLFDNH